MRKMLLLWVIVAAVGLGGCGGGDDETVDSGTDAPPAQRKDGETTVGVKGLEFVPDEVTIKVGETVRWKWDENLAHNVVPEGDETFGTGTKNLTKADVSHVFDEAGTYKYECTLHTGMDGTVEVEEE